MKTRDLMAGAVLSCLIVLASEHSLAVSAPPKNQPQGPGLLAPPLAPPNAPPNAPPIIDPNVIPPVTGGGSESLVGKWQNQNGGVIHFFPQENRILAFAPDFGVSGSVVVDQTAVKLTLSEKNVTVVLDGKITEFDPNGAPMKMVFNDKLFFSRIGAPQQKVQEPELPKLTKEEQSLVDLMNQERIKANLPALKVNARLMQAAKAHAENMSKQQVFARLLDGKSVAERVQAVGYQPRFVDENICKYFGKEGAYGLKTPVTPEEAAPYMANHPAQRNRILGTNFTDIGVAIVVEQNGTTWWNIIFAAQ